MAVPEVEAVLEFLRKNGFLEAETALKEELSEKGDLGSFDFEKFFFPMVPPPPPVRIPSRPNAGAGAGGGAGGGEWERSSGASSDDQFVSLGSSTSDVCSSDFTNPYGLRSSSTPNSETSSDRLSQFGTARAYNDFDMQNDTYIFDDKSDEGHFMTPFFHASESFFCPTEDKFVMTSEPNKESPISDENIVFVSKPDTNRKPENGEHEFGEMPDPYGSIEKEQVGYCGGERDGSAVHVCSVHHCEYCQYCAPFHGEFAADQSYLKFKKTDLDDLKPKRDMKDLMVMDSSNDWFEKSGIDLDLEKDFMFSQNESYEGPGGNESNEKPEAVGSQELEGGSADDTLILEGLEDDYEVFDLRVIHRKNRTGFEENKDLPIVLNTVLAGRYCITEYLGSAAFSKVVQAHDLHTGIDVCLKIIKNDKDFFDQSLDEIKLLKLVNKHDPADEHHILRLYDYFYHQEHLFIVCELLRANLYEFQKFNRESGGDVYFTPSRLQVITRQCLEALVYLHDLGIIHCDLKPENILIKSYRRSEIKIIDLGSSCFKSDNLCLYVQSRSYRAPEVILGHPYDQKIDIWSLGCILAELCSGEVLFPNDLVVTILARMIGMLGPIDLKMLVRGEETPKYFTEEYDLYYINEETDQLEFIIPEESSLEDHLQVSDVGFTDFVRSLLEINPKRRPTAKEALEHPWLSHQYPPPPPY